MGRVRGPSKHDEWLKNEIAAGEAEQNAKWQREK